MTHHAKPRRVPGTVPSAADDISPSAHARSRVPLLRCRHVARD